MPPSPDRRQIAGVRITPLRVIADDRGAVMHMLRADAPHFQGFGEIYFSVVSPGAVKAWRRHRSTVMNYAVPMGGIRLAIYDDRPGSPTHGLITEIETGPSAYHLITIPAGTWSGFLGLGPGPSLVANCATAPHDPNEADRLPPDDPAIPYRWRPGADG